jgi:hypothetical protein
MKSSKKSKGNKHSQGTQRLAKSSRMPRAFLIKFGEHTPNPYFEGKRFTDPNKEQPKTSLPHWEICEPRIRKGLDKGSILFFAPKGTWDVKYVLKVDERATTRRATIRLGKRWAKFYKNQACIHEGVSRYGDIIISSAYPESFSLGDGESVSEHIPDEMLRRLHNNGREFNDYGEAEKLYQWLKSKAVGG